MRLFVAEKPTVGRTIAGSLGGGHTSEGCIQCASGDIVTWCYGHLLDLAQPETYNPAWRNRYDRRYLPIVPPEIRLVPRDGAGVREQLGIIKRLLGQCSLVVHAGDPDREGQLLVDEVLEYLGYRGQTLRIFLASLDPKSVERALANLEDNAKYRHWRDAADTRRTVDWLGGINMSRAMTIFGNSIGLDGVLSLGRVQTPTLRIVVERERQIANFVPVDYAQIVAMMDHAKGRFTATFVPVEDTPGLDPEGRIIDFSVAEAIRAEALHLPGTVLSCERKTVKEAAKLPYALASLQSDMGAKHSLGAQQVLSIAQKLYESKLTTYPRTDCEYLPEEQFEQAKELLAQLGEQADLRAAVAGADAKLKSKAWNTKKVTAHHAIIPTGIRPSGLSLAEQQVYSAIALRYILQFWPPLEYESTKIRVQLENGTLWDASGKCVKKPGWTEIVRPDKKDEPDLPKVRKNDPVRAAEVSVVKKRTTPPPHFTEGTLITAMKNIHRFVEDKGARAKLRETSGLGTEATRANILEILKKRGYIMPKGKSLVSTSKGENVIDLCPNSMKDIVTTATLEDMLSDIQSGSIAAATAVTTYVNALSPMIAEVFANTDASIPNLTYEHCPVCGKAVNRFLSKKAGEYLWSCLTCHSYFHDADGHVGARIIVGDVSDTYTCPRCGKPAVRHARRDGTGYFWGCSEYPKCHWTAPDCEGKPGQPVREVSDIYTCPRCSKPLVRIRSKNGTGYFWGCSDYPTCRYTAEDVEGKPEERKTFPCPTCGKALVRIRRKDGSGYFWGCSNYPTCRYTAEDIEGKPEERKTFPCPTCGKALMRIRSKNGTGYFWGCSDYPTCRYTAEDVEGKPKERETFPCPTCGKPLMRIRCKNGTGYFWGCSDYPTCRYTAEDANGRPVSTAVYLCPQCNKPLARRQKDGAYVWVCTGYPTCTWAAYDADGKPGRACQAQ